MDEESQKRNTDCVYFLASPLTCKKGMECEYRHNEIARLNPRDCWFWLSGSCLNPSCAYRHPPLDVHSEATEALPDSTAQAQPGSIPVIKSNVPCYFFFNGNCIKGDKCSFFHGPSEDGKPGWKSSKTTSAVTAPPPTDAKTSTGSDAGSTPIVTNPNSSEAGHSKAVEMPNNHKAVAFLDNINKRSTSPHVPVSEPEEPAPVSSGTLLNGKDLINQSQASTDQSSDEQVNRHTEREEWLDSSPGFDVLVDDGSENLDYEDNPDYVLPIDREAREVNGHFYGYEVPAEYGAMYAADAVTMYDQERRASRNELDIDPRVDYVRNGNVRSMDDMIGQGYYRKRKYLPVDMVLGGRRVEDLRDHLKKRRIFDDRPFSRRNHIPSVVADLPRHRHRRREILTTEVDNPRVRARQPRPSNVRQRQRERRKPRHQTDSSEVMVSRKRRVTEEACTFSGPKTLAQIKEDKKMKSEERRNSCGRSGHRGRSTEEFQGPKPLSEILKEKSQVQ